MSAFHEYSGTNVPTNEDLTPYEDLTLEEAMDITKDAILAIEDAVIIAKAKEQDFPSKEDIKSMRSAIDRLDVLVEELAGENSDPPKWEECNIIVPIEPQKVATVESIVDCRELKLQREQEEKHIDEPCSKKQKVCSPK